MLRAGRARVLGGRYLLLAVRRAQHLQQSGAEADLRLFLQPDRGGGRLSSVRGAVQLAVLRHAGVHEEQALRDDRVPQSELQLLRQLGRQQTLGLPADLGEQQRLLVRYSLSKGLGATSWEGGIGDDSPE